MSKLVLVKASNNITNAVANIRIARNSITIEIFDFDGHFSELCFSLTALHENSKISKTYGPRNMKCYTVIAYPYL